MPKTKSNTVTLNNEPLEVLEERFLDSYSHLNDKQKEAVDTSEGPVMVIAGAGTGKTQILALRIANILRNPDLQMDPQNILCLTFTESAVVAMRERLAKVIGSAAYYVKIHTFHSFCNEVIKDNPESFLFSSDLNKAESNGRSIDFISELEQIETLNEIIDKLPGSSAIKPYGEPYFYRSDLISNIKTLKREAISSEQLLKTTESLEAFINKHERLIEDFISRHARTIKEEDCNKLIEELKINDGTPYSNLIQQYYDQSEKISEFKKKVKDFYEKNLKAIPKQKDLSKVYKEYQEALQRRKLYDFEDMILWVTDKFDNDPELLAKYQEQFQYILVDEYQDTNGAQNKILEKLTEFHGENANIFVVGDDDQAIYRFQGASIENINYFYRRFKNTAKFIVLENNYRSHQDILDASHSVIDNNNNRITKLIPEITKKLEAKSDIEKRPLDILAFDSPYDEIYFTAKKIKELIDAGTSPEEIAILYRTNRDVIDIVDIFSRLGVPFKVEAGDNILRDANISQLLDFFTIIYNPKNDNLLFNVLNYDFIAKDYELTEVYKITRLRSELARKQAQETDGKRTYLIDLLLENDNFKALAEKIIFLNQKSYNLAFDEFFELTVKESGYLNFIMEQANKIELLNKINSLFGEVKNLSRYGFSKTKDNFNLASFLSYIDLLNSNNIGIKENPLKTKTNAVNLLTAHRAKGLEFEYVFVFKTVDKHWGNRREMSRLKLPHGLIELTESMSGSEANEDERRLFYVALTRAKHHAFITYSKTNDKGKQQVPSIFIEELNKNHAKNSEDEVKNFEESKAHDYELVRLETMFKEQAEKDFSIEEKAFIEKCLENYKLSITHLNNYLVCPKLFFYQNLLRVPAAKNKHASFGTAVHAALYDLFTKNKTKDKADLEYLLKRFEEHLIEEPLTKQDFKDSLEFGQETLKKYYENYKNSFTEENLLEFDFSTKGINYKDLVLTGKLDKIEVSTSPNGERTVNVVDYKTGNPSNKSSELKAGGNYHRQVVFYKLLCDLAKESKQFPYEMSSGEIDFIQSTSDGKFIKKKIEVSDKDIENLKSEIEEMKSGMKSMEFPKTDDKEACQRCSFNKLCW